MTAACLPAHETPSRPLHPASKLITHLETPRLPLYLTQDEAEALLALCAAAPGSGGAAEAPLFSGLGELLRTFWREIPQVQLPRDRTSAR